MYRRFAIGLAAFAVLVASTSLCPRAALAANYYFSGASGTVWDATTADWSTASGGPYSHVWTTSTAHFEGTPTTVTVSGTPTSTTNLYFDVSGYTLNSGSITLSGTANNIYVPIGGSATINSNVSGGSASLAVQNGTLYVGGQLTTTGGYVCVLSGGKLFLTDTGSFASSTTSLYVNGTIGTAYTTSGGTHTNAGKIYGMSGGTMDFRDNNTNTVSFADTRSGLVGSGTWDFDLGAGTNDAFAIVGNLTAAGSIDSVNFDLVSGQHLVNGTYTIFTAGSGSTSAGMGTWNNNTGTLDGHTLATAVVGNTVQLTISGGSSGSPTPAISISSTASCFVLGSSLTGVISGTVSNSGTAAYSYTSITGSGTGTLASISPQSATVAASGGTQAYTATLNGTAATAGTSYTYGTTVTDGTTPASSSTVSLTAVNKRTVTSAAQVNLGDFLKGAVVSVSQDVSPTSSGSNATTANATVAAATGGTENGLTVSGSLQTFDGTASVTRTLSGTLDTSSYGTKTGSWNMAVTGEALPGMTAYGDATAGFTANVGNATAGASFGNPLSAIVSGSLAGLSSQTTNSLQTEALLTAGTGSGVVSMAWRAGTTAETNNSLGIQLISDVVQLTGALSADTTLQMSYTGNGNGGPKYLAELTGGTWHEVAGSIAVGGIASGTIGHAGTFAVVPEPATLALLATGLIGLLAYAWRKRK